MPQKNSLLLLDNVLVTKNYKTTNLFKNYYHFNKILIDTIFVKISDLMVLSILELESSNMIVISITV